MAVRPSVSDITVGKAALQAGSRFGQPCVPTSGQLPGKVGMSCIVLARLWRPVGTTAKRTSRCLPRHIKTCFRMPKPAQLPVDGHRLFDDSDGPC